jgi:uncharacterized protein (DUF2141 family)
VVGKSLIYWGILFAFLLGSCAQIGTISGGKKDTIAPRIVENGMNPPNGTTEFQAKQIRITFDEFIKLDNPSESILLVPEHAKIQGSIQKKTLILDIIGNLQAETTYKITLNAAVKDINEGNDSLIQYVFSTGKFIDSLDVKGVVKNALSQQVEGNILVGLYNDSDSSFFKKPAYYGKTNQAGEYAITYMKPGKYRAVAFEDKNKDLIFQKNERMGFQTDFFQLDSSRFDSIPILIYEQSLKPILRSKKFEGPLLVKLGANTSLENAEIFINDTLLNKKPYYYTSDSLSFMLPSNQGEKATLVFKNEFFNDTITLRLPEKEKSKKPTLYSNLKEGNLFFTDTLMVYFSDNIETIDTSLITLKHSDSIRIPYRLEQVSANTLYFHFQKKNPDIKLNFAEKSLLFQHAKRPFTQQIPIRIKTEKDFGSVVFFTDSLEANTVLELVQNNKVVRTFSVNESKKIHVENLDVGSYQLKGFLDENSNGKWDVGNFEENRQPEKRLSFPDEIKVRANWEIEINVSP